MMAAIMVVLETGALAPHFTLLGTDGREYALPRDTAGRPTLLVFFKNGCATCDLAFPYINRLPQAYPDSWHLWAIAQEPPGTAADYARRHGIVYPVLIDAPEYAVSRLYDPPATPTLFLTDPRGHIVYETHGFAKADLNQLSTLLAQSLGLEPVIIAPKNDGRPDFKPG